VKLKKIIFTKESKKDEKAFLMLGGATRDAQKARALPKLAFLFFIFSQMSNCST